MITEKMIDDGAAILADNPEADYRDLARMV